MIINKYKTKDLNLGALLVCNGFKLIDSENKPEGVYFVFQNDNDALLQNIISKFVDCTASVNLKKFTAALTIVRKEISKYR